MTEQEALIRLETLCSRSEQCRHDVRQKMRRWEVDESTAERVIERLVASRYIDDVRFAHAFVRDKYRLAGWGRIKITRELRLRHIAPDTIADAISEIDDDIYHQWALRIVAAKARTLKDTTSYQSRVKIVRYGASRGFETGVILDALNRYTRGDYEH